MILRLPKILDKASCKLIEAVCAGRHLEEVVISLRGAGGEKVKFFEIMLEEVIISNYLQTASDRITTETVSLNYGKIKTTYVQQNRTDGNVGGNVCGGWDRTTTKIYS